MAFSGIESRRDFRVRQGKECPINSCNGKNIRNWLLVNYGKEEYNYFMIKIQSLPSITDIENQRRKCADSAFEVESFQRITERTILIKEDLIAAVWAPHRIEAKLSQGLS